MISFLKSGTIEHIDLPDHVTFSRSTRAKRMTLRLDTKNRQVKLVVPQKASLHKAEEFVWAHEDWIQKQLSELAPSIPFIDGTKIPLLGADTALDIYYDQDLKRTSIALKNNTLSVKTNKTDPTGRILRHLKHIAREELTALTHQKAKTIDKTVKAIQIRDPKTRWGSCHEDGRISLSWRLILAPPEAMDYVVAHEVAHMIHMNHGKLFWALCEDLCSNYQKGKKWMRSQGHTLHSYGISE